MSEPLPPAGPAPADPSPDPATGSPAPAATLRYFPAESADGADHSYRSLSLLALIGFIVGSVYAAVVVLMGLAAFFSGKPLLLPGWTFVIPIVAILFCVLGRLQVRRSEGTLAGASLGGWGLLLSVFVLVSYLGYYAAVYFAIRQQAQTFATRWLELIKKDQLDRAAYYTLEPGKRQSARLEDPDLVEKIERAAGMLDNPAGPRSLMGHFGQQTFVRLLRQGGAEATVEPRGVSDWDYVRGGYQVTMNFQIRTPHATCDVLLLLHGSEVANNLGLQGREWQVNLQQSGVNASERPIEYTPLGHAMFRVSELVRPSQARTGFVDKWFAKLYQRHKLESFLDTLPEADRQGFLKKVPEADREKVGRAYERVAPLGALGAGVAGLAMVPDPSLLPRYHKFVEGELLVVDDKHFTGKLLEEELLNEVRKVFAEHPVNPPILTQAQTMPQITQRDGKLRIDCDLTLSQSRYAVELVLTVEADAKLLQDPNAPPELRVAGLRLLSGNKVSANPGGPGGPGGPPGGP